MTATQSPGAEKLVKRYITYVIEGYRDILTEHIEPEFLSINAKAEEQTSFDQEYAEVLAEEINIMEENLTEISNLFCVGLYVKTELLLNWLGMKFVDKSWEKTHVWKTLKQKYQAHGIDLESLDEYNAVNTLRGINNCMKHNAGKVDKELAKSSGCILKIDQELKMQPSNVSCYSDATKTFLYNIIDQLKDLGKIK